MNKRGEKKWQLQSYKNNMALMVSVCRRLASQKILNDFDLKYQRLSPPMIQKEKPIRWSYTNKRLIVDQKFLDRFDKKNQDMFLFMAQKMSTDFENILAAINLPVHFHEHVWNYVAYGEITAPSFNFTLRLHPVDPKADLAKVAAGGIQYIDINVYSPLTTEEKILAFKLLDRMSDHSFPEYIKRRFSSKDVSREIEVAEEAAKFRRAKIRTEYYGYIKELHKKYQKGEVSEKDFNRTKKLNQNDIVEIPEPGITSKKVAKKLGLTAQNAPTIRVCAT